MMIFICKILSVTSSCVPSLDRGHKVKSLKTIYFLSGCVLPVRPAGPRRGHNSALGQSIKGCSAAYGKGYARRFS